MTGSLLVSERHEFGVDNRVAGFLSKLLLTCKQRESQTELQYAPA
jgi:hypothetical protein